MKHLFQHSKIGSFFQIQPKLGNVYLNDGFLQRVLQRLLPTQIYEEVHKDLTRLGHRIEKEIEPLGLECEQNPPYLNQYDSWGTRIDEVVTCSAWKQMKLISAEEGIISSGYDGKYGQFSRIYQFAKCFIFHPSSGLYSCPLAMTDGAAKTIKALKLTQLDETYQRLISGDPSKFWTSGQWMTERKGGSDVAAGTETIAIPLDNTAGKYLLYGYKWFSSATDADISFTLARIVDKKGNTKQGTTGLSMFYLKTRKPDGNLNNVQVVKLKNKLGTRSLPTGELLLDGVEAELVSEEGRGVSSISHMLTMTRLHNTVGSIGGMRRVLLLARDFSKKRMAFGSEISKYPLHVDTMATMELEIRGGTVLLFEILRLLGLVESSPTSADEATPESLILRILTPVAKLYTAKKCMSVVSEGLECFGGQGYIEDTGLPAILRNAQVTPIWEGTTNVLSLDMLRAIATSKGAALIALHENLTSRLNTISGNADGPSQFSDCVQILLNELEQLQNIFPGFSVEEAMARARLLSFSIAEIVIGVLLLEHGSVSKIPSDAQTAIRWVQRLEKIQDKLKFLEPVTSTTSYDMVFDGYNHLESMSSKL